MQLDKLPIDVLRIILANLTLGEQAVVGGVCRQFRILTKNWIGQEAAAIAEANERAKFNEEHPVESRLQRLEEAYPGCTGGPTGTLRCCHFRGHWFVTDPPYVKGSTVAGGGYWPMIDLAFGDQCALPPSLTREDIWFMEACFRSTNAAYWMDRELHAPSPNDVAAVPVVCRTEKDHAGLSYPVRVVLGEEIYLVGWSRTVRSRLIDEFDELEPHKLFVDPEHWRVKPHLTERDFLPNTWRDISCVILCTAIPVAKVTCQFRYSIERDDGRFRQPRFSPMPTRWLSKHLMIHEGISPNRCVKIIFRAISSSSGESYMFSGFASPHFIKRAMDHLSLFWRETAPAIDELRAAGFPI